MGRHDLRRHVGQLVVVDPDQPFVARWGRTIAPYAASCAWLSVLPWAPVPAVMATATSIVIVRIVRSFPRRIGSPTAIIPTADQVQRRIDELTEASRALAADDPLQDEVGTQRQALVEQHRQMSEQIAARVTALRRLATRSSDFAYQRQAAADARQSLKRAADTAARIPKLPSDDPVRELTERTEAVLDAYRDLITQTGPAA